jgi:hypothetical protein
MANRRWTEEELAEVRRPYDEGAGHAGIARRLGRSVTAVETMVSVQGWAYWLSGGRPRPI